MCRTLLWSCPAVALALGLGACGGGGSSVPSAIPTALAAVSTSPPVAATTTGDDWVTFGHDQLRSGYQPQATGISAATVASLKLRWKYNMGAPVTSSPIVAGGFVYVAGSRGTVRALDARTGTPLWSVSLGAQIAMTPSLDDGMLIVGTHTIPGDLFALDAKSGQLKWQVPFAGGVRAEPAIANGIIYEGEAGGDPPLCNHGSVHALDERTGAILWTWYVNPTVSDGGSVWSPISFDGNALYFGSGNTCSTGIVTANSVVSLDRNGGKLWAQEAANSAADDDFGGGTLLLHSDAIAMNKNGMLYDYDKISGRIVWSTQVGHLDGYGGSSSPSSDGNTVVVGAGYLTDPTKTAGPPGGLLVGTGRSGAVVWSVRPQQPMLGQVSITNGVGFTALDNALVALNVETGATLWSYSADSQTYASPAVVPSGVYYCTDNGDVAAFSLPGSAAAQGQRSRVSHALRQRSAGEFRQTLKLRTADSS